MVFNGCNVFSYFTTFIDDERIRTSDMLTENCIYQIYQQLCH